MIKNKLNSLRSVWDKNWDILFYSSIPLKNGRITWLVREIHIYKGKNMAVSVSMITFVSAHVVTTCIHYTGTWLCLIFLLGFLVGFCGLVRNVWVLWVQASILAGGKISQISSSFKNYSFSESIHFDSNDF